MAQIVLSETEVAELSDKIADILVSAENGGANVTELMKAAFEAYESKMQPKGNDINWRMVYDHDGDELRQVAQDLREQGVRAKTKDSSPYVGHLQIFIASDDLEKAAELLRGWGDEFMAECCEEEAGVKQK